MDDDQKNNEVIDITGLVGKFKSRKELQMYSEKLFLAFKESVQKLQRLELENAHLKQMLDSMVPTIVPKTQTPILNAPNEQVIAEIQLERLKSVALDRDLTLDETKRYDVLVKNLYLSKGKPTKVIDAQSRRLEDASEAELIQMVKKSDE